MITPAELHALYLRAYGDGASATTPEKEDLARPAYFDGWKLGYAGRERAAISYAKRVGHLDYLKSVRNKDRK